MSDLFPEIKDMPSPKLKWLAEMDHRIGCHEMPAYEGGMRDPNSWSAWIVPEGEDPDGEYIHCHCEEMEDKGHFVVGRTKEEVLVDLYERNSPAIPI